MRIRNIPLTFSNSGCLLRDRRGEGCDEIYAKAQNSHRRGGQHHAGGFPSAAGVGKDEDARGCQNGLQPDTDPKYFMVEKGKIQKKDWIAHFFKKRNKVKPT
jgi:hypothetical protein